MSKQAVVKAKSIKVGAAAFSTKDIFAVVKVGTAETFKLTPKFVAEAQAIGDEVGGILQTLKQRSEAKAQFALNLISAFGEYKRITKNGFPAFVHDHIDPTCPSSHGKVGSDDRRKLTSHSRFNGLRTLLDMGTKAIEREKTRQALIDAGHNPDDAEDVGKVTADERAAKAGAFQTEFNRCLIAIDQHGATEVTIGNLLICLGKHPKKEKDTLTKAGVTMRDSAVNAVLKARTNRAKNVTPAKSSKANGTTQK